MTGRSPLRVGLDAFPALTHPPGVGRYARELARAVTELGEAGPVLLELGRGRRILPPSSLGAAAHLRRLVPIPERAGRLLARVGLDPARLCGSVDVFHQVRRGWIPVRSAPTTTAVSEWCAPGQEEQLAAELSSHSGIFVFSGDYATRLEQLGVASELIHQVPVGADHWTRELAQDATSPAHQGPPRLLVLGAPREGRGHLEILSACEELHAGGLALELLFVSTRLDPTSSLAGRVEASPLREAVTWIAPREAELPALVRSCDLLVHLSADEGTPVTPAEAAHLGLRLLLSPLPAFQETLGGLALWHAPDQPLAPQLEAALGFEPDPVALELLREATTWSRSASAHLRAWRRICGS